VEQASLAQLVQDRERTRVFAWYNLAGSFATATGALAGGWLAQGLQYNGWTANESYRVVLMGYALGGLLLFLLFLNMTNLIEVNAEPDVTKRVLGLHRSRNVVFKLSSLFALDAFAGGLLVQSLIAFWFHIRFGVEAGILGSIFFGANILAGISALVAVPLMPTLPLAAANLLLRFSISQMDVPTRQSYTMAVVDPDERSAASGVTAIARSLGASISPALTGWLIGIPVLFSAPFFLSGGLKIIYDLLLYREFRAVKPPEEKA
jgi:MFS family permease